MNKEELHVKGNQLLSKVKQLIKQGNIHRILIKDSKDRIIANVPAGYVVLAALWTPLLVGLSAGIALFSDYVIEIHKKET